MYFKIAITFDGDVHFQNFDYRWKALNLSFGSVGESPKMYLTIKSYRDFELGSRNRKCNPQRISETLISKSAIGPKRFVFRRVGKRRLRAFDRFLNQRLRTSPSKVMTKLIFPYILPLKSSKMKSTYKNVRIIVSMLKLFVRFKTVIFRDRYVRKRYFFRN